MERILELVKELQEEYQKSYGVDVRVSTYAFEEGGFPTEKHAKEIAANLVKLLDHRVHLGCRCSDMPGKDCSAVLVESFSEGFEQVIYYPAIKEVK